MRIISWNCNGAFRNKINSILSLNEYIYVIIAFKDIFDVFVDAYVFRADMPVF